MCGMYGHFEGFSLLFGHGLGWCHVVAPVSNDSFLSKLTNLDLMVVDFNITWYPDTYIHPLFLMVVSVG